MICTWALLTLNMSFGSYRALLSELHHNSKMANEANGKLSQGCMHTGMFDLEGQFGVIQCTLLRIENNSS